MKTERKKFEYWWRDAGDCFEGYDSLAWKIWQAAVTSRDKEVEQLEAKVAMLHCGLNGLVESNYDAGFQLAGDALSSTEADVKKFINGIKADALEEAVGMNAVEIVRKVREL